jgi:hypothetical protein
MSEPFIEAANITSVDAPADVDEWDISGLTRSTSVSPFHLAAAAVTDHVSYSYTY